MIAIFDRFVDRLLIASSLLAGTAILIQLAIWILRSTSPRTQRFAWGCVLAQGLLFARFSLAIPWYHAATQPLPEVTMSQFQAESAPEPADLPSTNKRVEPVAPMRRPEIVVAGRETQSAAPSVSVASKVPAVTWQQFVVSIWSIGLVGLVSFAVLQYVRFVRGLRKSTSPPPQWIAEFLDVRRACDVRREIPLRVTETAGPSLCWRPFRYELLVPAEMWSALASSQRRAILRHELAHYQRGDLWIALLFRLIAALHWFNPLAWWALVQFETCSEWACDDRATDEIDATDFARTLMQLGGALSLSVPLTDSVRSSPLFSRIGRLLRAEKRMDSLSVRWLLCAVATFSLIAGAIRLDLVADDSATTPPARGGAPVIHAAAGAPVTHVAGSRVDLYGDPLPNGAILRLGTTRLRMNDFITHIAFSPDKTFVAATGGNLSGIRLFETTTGKLVQQLDANKGMWNRHGAIVFNPAGDELLSAGSVEREGGGRAALRAWNVENGQELWSLELNGKNGTALAISRNGKLMAAGTESGAVTVWDTASRQQLHQFGTSDAEGLAHGPAASIGPPLGSISDVAFSQDGQYLAAAANIRSAIRVWNLKTDKEIMHIPDTLADEVQSLAFTADGKQVVSGGNRLVPAADFGKPTFWGKVRVPEICFWDRSTGQKQREFHLEEPTDGSGALALSADGKTLISGVSYNAVVWDIASGRVRRQIAMPHWWGAGGLALSADGVLLAAPDGDGIVLANVSTGELLLTHQVAHRGVVTRVIHSPDGSTVYTASSDGKVIAWESATGKAIFELSQGPNGHIHDVAISNDGKRLATAGMCTDPALPGYSDYFVRIADARNGSIVRDLRDPRQNRYYPIRRVAFSLDGRGLAVATGIRSWNQDDIDLWDVDSGKKTAELRPEPMNWQIKGMSFSPDGKTLLACSQDSLVRRWNVETATLEKEFRALDRPARRNYIEGPVDAAFTPDTTHLITSDKRSLFTWDTSSGEIVSVLDLPGHDKGRWIGLSPDGHYAATADVNFVDDAGTQLIRVFDRTNGAEVFTFDPGGTRAHCFSFSPDGKRLVGGMADGTALVWELTNSPKLPAK